VLGWSCAWVVDTVGVPGLAAAALTVGALNRQGGIADFSSRGPVTLDGSGRTEPDVMAPGVGVISSLPDERYAEFSGIAMAVSHLAGTAALLWSADPALKWNIDRTAQIIEATA
jgi:subtilisin family serine protease